MRTFAIASLSLVALGAATGCAGVAIQPGHRALYFDPSNGGIQHEVLQPGWYATPCPFWQNGDRCPKVDDFDVTYSTSKEHVNTLSEEGLPLQLDIAVVYRPIVAELYALDTEIGRNYFDEVIGPEFRSAAIGVFAHNSYSNLQKKNGDIEDQIEKALRERLRGKHVEISSVLIEKVTYATEILESERERVVSQEQTLRNKQLLENQALQRKRELELSAETKKLEVENQAAQRKMELTAQTEQKKMELQAQAEQQKLAATTELEVKKIEIQKTTDEEKFRIDSELRNKQAERRLTLEQADIDRLKAQSASTKRVTEANGEATARLALAKALTEENKAAAATVSPMQVMMHAYDALGQLGGSGTNLMLGDWSKVPSFLFPRIPAFQNAMGPWYTLPGAPAAPAPADTKVSQRDPTPAP
jgi:regulator of protease activity HflC (stomatin/prohibitin superfamily)